MIDHETYQRNTATPGDARPFSVVAENLPIWRELFAGLDWLALRVSAVYRGDGVAHGRGTPVVVVPGLFATDSYLFELRNWLGRVGYKAYRSRIGRNSECPRIMVERLLHTVEQVHRETGMRVCLVGHSLGGLLARGAAIRRPDLIAEVITVGSPINGVRAHPTIIAAARRIGDSCGDECISYLQAPLPVGVTEASIYSHSDGVVGWASCLPASGAPAVRVRSTHSGLIFSHESYTALATLLDRAISRRRSVIIRGPLRLIHGHHVKPSIRNHEPALTG